MVSDPPSLVTALLTAGPPTNAASIAPRTSAHRVCSAFRNRGSFTSLVYQWSLLLVCVGDPSPRIHQPVGNELLVPLLVLAPALRSKSQIGPMTSFAASSPGLGGLTSSVWKKLLRLKSASLSLVNSRVR